MTFIGKLGNVVLHLDKAHFGQGPEVVRTDRRKFCSLGSLNWRPLSTATTPGYLVNLLDAFAGIADFVLLQFTTERRLADRVG
jgi:hypothetical protein